MALAVMCLCPAFSSITVVTINHSFNRRKIITVLTKLNTEKTKPEVSFTGDNFYTVELESEYQKQHFLAIENLLTEDFFKESKSRTQHTVH